MQQNPRSATEHKIGKRRSTTGKRKSSFEQQQQQQQSTISELFSSSNSGKGAPGPGPHISSESASSSKRPRLSSSSLHPSSDSQPPTRSVQDVIPTDNMCNFGNNSGSSSTADGGGPFARKSQSTAGGGSPSSAINNRPSFNNASSFASSRQSNFSPHTGAKRLLVKNLRTEPRLNQDSYFDKVWARLDAALAAVFESRRPDVSLEELYKGAENVCRQGRAAVLAKKLQDRCREYVSGKLHRVLVSKAENGSDALRAVVDAWSAWNLKLVCVIFTKKKKNKKRIK